MSSSRHELKEFPTYLQDAFCQAVQGPADFDINSIEAVSISQVEQLNSPQLQRAHLLLLRHRVTTQISESGVLHPPFLIERSQIYEALGYADLAIADAFVAYTLCETIHNEEWVSDLEPTEISGDAWLSCNNLDVLSFLTETLSVLCRCLSSLGAAKDANDKREELLARYGEAHPSLQAGEVESAIYELLQSPFCLRQGHDSSKGSVESRFGLSRREVYPWNAHEPDRNSASSIKGINRLLEKIAPDLEARVTTLPALNNSSDAWHQLGLFAKKDLAPSSIILQEKSILTAIRPLDDALCDACGADLESVLREEMRQCPGVACDVTFCSEECSQRAPTEYHRPNDVTEDDEEDDYPPAYAPFCGNTALHEIGRISSTNTAEWDLYFLLLTRVIQMSVTQNVHVLDLPEIRYLWGDFESGVDAAATLPFSLYHNVQLPLQFFETLMHSMSLAKPYTKKWLVSFDWWIIQTLYAKFRGVANAQQSTFDGKPEIAAVHPMWCLANHSCAPNVQWTPTGVRKFQVLAKDKRISPSGTRIEWSGIKANEEIWSHYTDVQLPMTQRKELLREVLGGECRCERCLQETHNLAQA